MAHVAVIGAGNIGSHVLPHIARMPGVTAVTIVDPDHYDQANLETQNVSTPDVGKSKAQAQARRLRQIDRSLAVRPYQKPVEDLPLGWLRSDVILACLDSRRARMVVNQAAFRLGVPWIDAGVDASGLLVRVQVFMPGAEANCLECAWGPRDYDLVEQRYPCAGDVTAPASGASASLGALAASIQALECAKLLAGDVEHLLVGRDVMVDARHHRHYVTQFRRNGECRMPDHEPWRITPYDADPASTTLDELLALGSTLRGAEAGAGVHISVAGQQIAMTLTCGACGRRTPAGHVRRGATPENVRRCQSCGGRLEATGFDLFDSVACDALPDAPRRQSLASFGLVSGDVITLTTPELEVHFELGGTAWPTAS